jgi:hypothetical protein
MTPTNLELYNQVKEEINKIYKKIPHLDQVLT